MNDKESFNNSENNPVETTPRDSVAEDANTPLGVDESSGTEAPAEVDPFDPPLSTPDVPPAAPDVLPNTPLPDAPDAPPDSPDPSEPKTPIEGLEGETQPTAEPYGGANGEKTGDQVNRIES